MDDWQQDDQQNRMNGVPPQMQDRFGGQPPNFDELQLPPSRKLPPTGVIIAIVGGLVAVLAGLVVVLLIIVMSGDEEEVVTESVETVQVVEKNELAFDGISNDDLRKEIMDRTTKAGWQYTWKDERKNDYYEAWDLVLERKTKRIGLTVYVSDKRDQLDAIADETEAPNLAKPFKSALFVFAPMPGQPMSKKVLAAFEDE